jgi:transposase InsO family protein
VCTENPLWGAPRIHGELAKLGITVTQATVSKYMIRERRPPSQTWRTFLKNHAPDIAAIDFFTVPIAGFRNLYVFLVLAHDRRRVLHFNVTDSPTAAWTSKQIAEAFPWETASRFLLRDRDGVYAAEFRKQVKALDIEEVLTAPRSPWQNPFVERIIGSVRRECLDHVIILVVPGFPWVAWGKLTGWKRSRNRPEEFMHQHGLIHLLSGEGGRAWLAHGFHGLAAEDSLVAT